jgi:hypothetical protein
MLPELHIDNSPIEFGELERSCHVLVGVCRPVESGRERVVAPEWVGYCLVPEDTAEMWHALASDGESLLRV